MNNYYTDSAMSRMLYEERLRQAEQERLARRVAAGYPKQTPLGKLLAHMISLGAVYVGLRMQ